ncbi:hypothetical protein J437_LFUL019573 [Ladona fulva]|nr:hypothetical protein J437_LFUL019573 [Ladona fulva]
MVRICIDFQITLNPNITPNQHPIPTFEELTAKIARGQEFMVTDLKDAYLQMEVKEQCQSYPIIATNVGYFQIKVVSACSFSNNIWMSSCKGSTALLHCWIQAAVVPYDETRPLELACDVSEHLSAQDWPTAYASRTLTEAERHYAPIDKEAQALVFGVAKFHNYLWGRPFKLKTGHKPLERIFGEKQDLPKVASNRLQCCSLYLHEYNYKVEYQPSKENQCADPLSRLPMPTTMRSSSEHKFVNLVMGGKQQTTAKDPVLSKIKFFVDLGWPMQNDKVDYFERQEEMSVECGIILWGNPILIITAQR